MVEINKIQVALQGLVGYKQPFNPEYAIVNVDNQKSDSGYFVTDNSFAKIEFIKDSQDYLHITDEEFNDYLRGVVDSSISSVVNQVFIDYDFIDRDLLFKNAMNKVNTISLPNGFVGYRVRPSGLNKAVHIKRALLEFDLLGDIEILLFNTSSKEPIKRKTVTITSDIQQVDLDWYLNNSSNFYEGDYYIGYLTAGLVVKPFARDYNNASVKTDYLAVDVESVYVKNHNVSTLFDLRLIEGYSENIGLNLDISVYDDYTDFVIGNKLMFARAIQLEAIIHCIQLYMGSIRNNSNSVEAKILYDKMMIDLEGFATNRSIDVKGLKNKLVTEITMIRAEIQKIRKGIFKSGQIFVSTMKR